MSVMRVPRDGAGAPRGEKRAAQVARAIEGEARSRGWPTGELLGSEASLMERYQVSRAILREAVRLVEHNQLATMRRGPNGGLILRAPEVGPAATAAAVYLEYAGTTVDNLLEARLVLEPIAAGLAARRIDDDGFTRVRELLGLEAGPGWQALPGAGADKLHLLIAELSGNPALVLLIQILASLTAYYVSGVRGGSTVPESVRAASLAAHSAMADAVISGDASLAERRVTRHLAGLGEWLGSQGAHRFSSGPVPAADAAAGKMAEAVARNIRLDIAEEGWNVGVVIGSEAELVGRHQVSRAVLREAVRILEHHSVARMRRGPGGGLVVAEPQPMASIEAMALYLDRQRIDVAALRTVLAAVQLACVGTVAARAGEPGVRAALLDARAVVSPQTPEHDLEAQSSVLHRRICELSGNPVLVLFFDIMTAVWSRHSMAAPGPEPNPALSRPVMHAHDKIVEALLNRDAALARHRLSRHLDAMTDWWH